MRQKSGGEQRGVFLEDRAKENEQVPMMKQLSFNHGEPSVGALSH